MRAQASTMAKRPNRNAVSSTNAMKRSPNRAKRYRGCGRAEFPVAATESAGSTGSMIPDSSNRCWLGGMVLPQCLHRFKYEVVWRWQNGHSMSWSPEVNVQWAKHTLAPKTLLSPRYNAGRTMAVRPLTNGMVMTYKKDRGP